MIYTEEDKENLRTWRKTIDCDDIKIKEKIKKIILSNQHIIYVLDNKELMDDKDSEAEDYFGVNIFPYYIIKPTQTDVQNYICFECDYRNEQVGNKCFKRQRVIFYILCETSTIKEQVTGLPRHDLLAALILDQFNWTNYFGGKIHCISDTAETIDSSYACRVLVFEQITDNNLTKTIDGNTRLINKDVVM